MGTLNPNIPSPELAAGHQRRSRGMRATGRTLLTPAMLLLTFVREPGTAAHRMLTSLAVERSFRLDELAASAEAFARAAPGQDADFVYAGRQRAHPPLHRDADRARRRRAASPRPRARRRWAPSTRWAGWPSAAWARRASCAATASPARRWPSRLATQAQTKRDRGPGPGGAGQGRRGRAGLRARGPDARPAGAADAGEPPPRHPGGRRGRGPAVARAGACAADGRGQGAGGSEQPGARCPSTRCCSTRRRRSTTRCSRRATASSSSRTSSASSAARRSTPSSRRPRARCSARC